MFFQKFLEKHKSVFKNLCNNTVIIVTAMKQMFMGLREQKDIKNLLGTCAELSGSIRRAY